MFKKILIPVDVDEEATWKKAAEVAAHMAESSGAELHVITVVPDFGLSIVGSYFPEDFEVKALKKAGEELDKFVTSHFSGKIDVHAHVAHGKIYQEIISAADKLECDAIVMASHRPELKDYLVGPNAERVVRHATQSVVIVRD